MNLSSSHLVLVYRGQFIKSKTGGYLYCGKTVTYQDRGASPKRHRNGTARVIQGIFATRVFPRVEVGKASGGCGGYNARDVPRGFSEAVGVGRACYVSSLD
jgi:hypothetical protein